MFHVGFRLQTRASLFCWSGRRAHHWVFLWWVAHIFITPHYFVEFLFSCFHDALLPLGIFFLNQYFCLQTYLMNNIMLGRNSNNRFFFSMNTNKNTDSLRSTRCESHDSGSSDGGNRLYHYIRSDQEEMINVVQINMSWTKPWINCPSNSRLYVEDHLKKKKLHTCYVLT